MKFCDIFQNDISVHAKFPLGWRQKNDSTRLRRILVRLQGASIGAYQDISRWMQRSRRARRQAISCFSLALFGSPYKAVQVIKKRVIISRKVLILLGHSFELIDVTY